MKKSKKRHSGKSGKFHGDISNKPGTPQDPADHVATSMKDPQGGLHQGTELGTQPGPFPSSNVYGIQGGSYPGQDIGA